MTHRNSAALIIAICVSTSATLRADLVLSSGGQANDNFEFPTIPSKWDPGANTASLFSADAPPGTPGGATWSIMGAGFSDASGLDTTHGAITTSAISALGFTVAEFEDMIDTALNVWAEVSGFTNLGQVADGGVNAGASQASGGHLGDIRIAAWDFTFPFNLITLAHAATPGTEPNDGDGGTLGGDLHISTAINWVDDPFDTLADDDFDLLTVLIHELGHSLGLDHSNVVGSVMENGYMGARRTLTADDIAGIQAIYGPPVMVPEPHAMLLMGILLLFASFGVTARRRNRSAPITA